MSPSTEQAALLTKDQEIVEAARDRLIGVKRAWGSLNAQLREKWARGNKGDFDGCMDIARKLAVLRGEADALCDRFGLPTPDLLLGVNDGALGLAARSPWREVERDETGLLERRSYAEVRGTETDALIILAGPRPWPELTHRQREWVARQAERRAREQEQRESVARRWLVR